MADRVNCIETKQAALETLVDKYIAEFISLKDRMPPKQSFSAVVRNGTDSATDRRADVAGDDGTHNFNEYAVAAQSLPTRDEPSRSENSHADAPSQDRDHARHPHSGYTSRGGQSYSDRARGRGRGRGVPVGRGYGISNRNFESNRQN